METQIVPINRLVELINNNSHAEVIKSLADDIHENVEKRPVQSLINNGCKKSAIENILAVIILKYASMLNVGNNLKHGQALEIAKALLQEFPLESLDNFKLAFQYGVRAKYGQIFRFDIAVAFEWVRKYLDDYYEYREQWNREKYNKQQEEVPNETAKKYIEQWLKVISADKPVTPLCELADETGRKKAVSAGYKPDLEYAVKAELRRQWMRESFDPHTGRPRANALSFEEWLLRRK
ncbi:MAG: hypothetical protein KatS3mg031_2974 [Chitinophagales bacterium]|nr:MAG: hypothetical protein KatS3mg031_2974 [Chitinophagales bacterium]